MADWLKEWAIPLSAGVTLLLAIAAFWAIWQNYSFRREDRKRERRVRSADELCGWIEEGRKLLYSPYYEHKDEINSGLKELVRKAVAATAAAILVGDEFVGLTKRAAQALVGFQSAIKAEIEEDKPVDNSVTEEFRNTFESLYFYLSLLRTWDYDYDTFVKDARTHGALPLSQHLHPES